MVRFHPPAPHALTPTPTPVPALVHDLRRLLDAEDPARGERWVVAFSGGPDSTALAALLSAPAAERGLELLLAHVDHRLDPRSADRADAARALAARLGLAFEAHLADTPTLRRRGESPETAARRVRYQALEEIRRETGATRLLTAHHRDDQVETVLLQLLRGTPVERLAGIPARRGAIWRPLLAVRRGDLLAFLSELGLEPVDDATNRDLAVPRNRVRHQILPHLREADPDIDDALLALAARSAALKGRLEAIVRNHEEKTRKTFIEGTSNGNETKASIEGKDRETETFVDAEGDRQRRGPSSFEGSGELHRLAGAAAGSGLPVSTCFLTALPEPLRPPALRWLLEREGVVRFPSFPSMEAFLSCLSDGHPATLEIPPTPGNEGRRLSPFPSKEAFPSLVSPDPDATLEIPPAPPSAAFRFSSFPSMEARPPLPSGNRPAASNVGSEARRLVARRGEIGWEPPKSRTPPFSYTFSMPGEVELPELGLRLRIRRVPVEPWMLRGDRERVGFESESDRATVRSRTPGERMRPLGAPGSRKLKAILIDRGVPAEDRDRLPLLVLEGELAWVPGVAVGERFALRGAGDCWLAELEALPEVAGASKSGERTTS